MGTRMPQGAYFGTSTCTKRRPFWSSGLLLYKRARLQLCPIRHPGSYMTVVVHREDRHHFFWCHVLRGIQCDIQELDGGHIPTRHQRPKLVAPGRHYWWQSNLRRQPIATVRRRLLRQRRLTLCLVLAMDCAGRADSRVLRPSHFERFAKPQGRTWATVDFQHLPRIKTSRRPSASTQRRTEG